MRSEASRSLAAASAAPPPPPSDRLVTDLLLYLDGRPSDAAPPGDPTAFATQFDALAAWVDASLDAFRPELSRLLYPLFVHAYLALVSRGAAATAASLLASHKARFADAGGRAPRARGAELAALAAITSPAAAAGDRTAAAARGARYPVTLCTHSFDLLAHHLRSARLGLMLALVNDHVALRVRPGQPSATPPGGGDEPSLLTGALAGDAATVNATPLMLVLLKDAAVTAHEAELAAAADAVPEAMPDGRPLTKKARAALVKVAEKEKATRAKAAAATVDSTDVPLPEPSEADVAAAVDDLRHRARADSSAGAPSTVMFTFVNTGASLNAVALADDASLVVGGYADGSVRLYDVAAAARGAASADGDAPHPTATTLRGHSGAVYAVDVGPRSRLAFSGGADGTLRAWSVGARAPVAAYRGHVLPIWAVAACPRGAYVATGGADRAARVWCTERATPVRLLAGHAADVCAVAWHPNAHYVATGGDDATVRLWDVRSGGPARVLVRHRAPVTSIAFGGDGLSLATGDEDGRVVVWDIGAAAPRADAPTAHAGAVWSLSWARGADSTLLASGGADDAVRVWDGGAASAPHGGASAAAPAPGGAASTAKAPVAPAPPLTRVADYGTKATPVYAVAWSARNLLMAGGTMTLR